MKVWKIPIHKTITIRVEFGSRGVFDTLKRRFGTVKKHTGSERKIYEIKMKKECERRAKKCCIYIIYNVGKIILKKPKKVVDKRGT